MFRGFVSALEPLTDEMTDLATSGVANAAALLAALAMPAYASDPPRSPSSGEREHPSCPHPLRRPAASLNLPCFDAGIMLGVGAPHASTPLERCACGSASQTRTAQSSITIAGHARALSCTIAGGCILLPAAPPVSPSCFAGAWAWRRMR